MLYLYQERGIAMIDNRIAEKAASYIEEHLDEELSLDILSDKLHYSKFYISRVFAEKAGCTIYKYIQGRRLTLAAEKLTKTQKPIAEIAYEANYGSQQAFTLAFHQVYCCTPLEYRKRGAFYPKQEKIGMSLSGLYGGKMAA